MENKKENIQPAAMDDDIEEIEDVQEDPDNIRYYNPKTGGLTEMERKAEAKRIERMKQEDGGGEYMDDPNFRNLQGKQKYPKFEEEGVEGT